MKGLKNLLGKVTYCYCQLWWFCCINCNTTQAEKVM